MNWNVYMYILVMAGVTYLIRMLPLVLFKKEITSPFFEIFFVLCPLCLSGSDDLSCHPDSAVLGNDRRRGRAGGCTDRGIPGKKPSDCGAFCLRSGICSRESDGNNWVRRVELRSFALYIVKVMKKCYTVKVLYVKPENVHG